MADTTGGGGRRLRGLLWTARIAGGLFVAVLAFVIVVNFVTPTGDPMPEGSEWFGLAMFPFGVFVAHVLAFRWELVGGALAILCLLGWLVHVSFVPAILPIAGVLAIPAVLYVIYGLLARKRAGVAAAGETD
jgi:hypothetical protein